MTLNPPEQSQNAQLKIVEPVLQFCVYCDSIGQDRVNKPILIGLFDEFKFRTFPSLVSQFFITLRWINGTGSHKSAVRILDPNRLPVFTSTSTAFVLKHRADPFTCNYSIQNFRFSRPGVYWVEVLLNGSPYSSYPISVLES